MGSGGGISKIQIKPMVKINKTLGLALLTALAASCSSDNDVAGTSNPTIENGEANYATLKIDLPTRAGVRAVDFKDADGLKDEYKVNDATLLVFKKGTGATSENEYTFVEKVDLGNMTWTDPSATSITGVTTSANVTAELKKATIKDLKDGNIYGLVILNNVTKDGKGTKITIPAEGTKYSEWNVPGSVTTDANKVANMTDISKGIVMANAPEWTTSGQAPTTLVWIHGDKVKPTKAQAEAAGAAADIHVERGLAKVTLAQYGKDNTIPVDDKSTYNDFTVKLDAWALDVTNKTSFPIHKTDGLADATTGYADIWKYAAANTKAPTTNRFQDHTSGVDFKRVYWGIDPNYSGSTLNTKESLAECQKAFNMVHDMQPDGQAAAFKDKFGDDNPQYCLENTFDIDNMTQGQTTRVLVKAKLSVPATKGEGGNLDDNDPYQPSDDNNNNLYKINNISELYTAYDLKSTIEGYILDNFGKTVTVYIDGTALANSAGEHELADDNFTKPASGAKGRTRAISKPTQYGLTPEEAADIVKAFKITTYKNGVCYYVGRIKHFGDDETPWNQGDPTYYDTAKLIDKATGNKNWLGRYGVLRNNWYSLSVGSVSAPGDPTIPQVVPENPDDDNFNYINLKVNVLKWAKREQGFDL